jgi:hypothetical protein
MKNDRILGDLDTQHNVPLADSRDTIGARKEQGGENLFAIVKTTI